ncbi:hypothetical protein [Streptomyces sp. NPDC127114]|uniref:hypothetical protein n=1 Tax=Streptomyces sp. NPDC127114 TaxID=3345366 RepID=UPI003644DE55
MSAHVLGFAISYGAALLRNGAVVRHTCDESSCQNPDHWLVGERLQNIADYAARRGLAGHSLADVRGAAVAAGVLLAAVLAPIAHAEGPGVGLCEGADMDVQVCAEDTTTDAGRVGIKFVPSGGAAPAPRIDPEVLARRAVDSMRLDGPAVASSRAAGTHLVGMPMWMWTTPSPNTFGPITAFATAGGVTVTATAKVTSVRWVMGDGATVTCAGPGTPYQARYGAQMSPTCGHRYTKAEHQGSATATWRWKWSAPALFDAGTLTETRHRPRGAPADRQGRGERAAATHHAPRVLTTTLTTPP